MVRITLYMNRMWKINSVKMLQTFLESLLSRSSLRPRSSRRSSRWCDLWSRLPRSSLRSRLSSFFLKSKNYFLFTVFDKLPFWTTWFRTSRFHSKFWTVISIITWSRCSWWSTMWWWSSITSVTIVMVAMTVTWSASTTSVISSPVSATGTASSTILLSYDKLVLIHF